MMINIKDHYWMIGGSAAEVYSSATNTMVPAADPTYVAWAAINRTSSVADVAELSGVVEGFASPLPEWLLKAKPTFVQPTPTTYTKDQLKAYNADARWRKEQGGIVSTAGFPQHTDDRAQAKVTGTYTAQKEVPAVTTPWHASDGTVHPLDAAGLYQLQVDVLTHINDCFSRSGDAVAQIDAGTITGLAQIDEIYAAAITQSRKDWMKGK